MKKKAVLLINLGTPDDVQPRSVRRYLSEFLMDGRVIDLPFLIRWVLVNLFIIPFRYKKTTTAYQQIWMSNGSPLLTISEKIKEALARELGQEYVVELGMRYGKPSIESALQKLRVCDSISVIPLFPQYSSAANGSALEKTLELIAGYWNIPAIKIVNDFYDYPGFIAACADVIQKSLDHKNNGNDGGDKSDKNNKSDGNSKIDLLIFSYHGLPERHISKSLCAAQCDHVHACPVVESRNRFCYRAQCYATSRLIAEKLGLSSNEYIVSFQSRLGRTPWIKPYTDLLLPELIQKGVRNVAVVSPSFVADCLETLEEINIRMRKQWRDLGGGDFVFIPCVNDHEVWVKGLASMVS